MSKSSVQAINSVLADDFIHGRLVFNSNISVSRSHYSQLLGLPEYWVPENVEAFRAYDDKLREVVMHNARKRLYQAIADGTLLVRNGKVERDCFHALTGVPRYAIDSWPEFGNVLEEFDDHIRNIGYLPTKQMEMLNELKIILRDDCPLAKSHRQIAQLELARRLNTTQTILKGEPFVSVIREKQKQLELGVGLPYGDVIVNGKVYPFSSMLNDWSKEFVIALGASFKIFMVGKPKSSNAYAHFSAYIRWMECSNLPICIETRKALNSRALVPSEVWMNVLTAYLDFRSKCVKRTSLKTELASLKATFIGLSASGVLPELSRKIRLPGRVSPSVSHIQSIAEVTRERETAEHAIEFSAKALRAACSKFGADYDEEGGKAFLVTFREELIRSPLLQSGNIPQAVLSVINARLDAIEGYALKIISNNQSELDTGRQLIGQSTLPHDFMARVKAVAKRSVQRNALIHEFFPMTNSAVARTLTSANLLRLACQHNANILPYPHRIPTTLQILGGGFFLKRYSWLGGRTSLQAHLTASQDAVSCAAILFQVKSAANISVCLELGTQCMRPSATPDHTQIVGHKGKALGKAIFSDLPASETCIKSMRWVLDTCAPLRRIASRVDAKRLFLVVRGRGAEPLSPNWYRVTFKRFIEQIPELRGLALVPSMLRPSVLLKAALEDDGRLLRGMSTGQHGLNVTSGYQGKPPVREIYDKDMRRFLAAFETLGLVHASRVSDIQGYSPEQIAIRIKSLEPTGLGTFCKDAFGKPGNEGRKCTQPDCLGTEETCPQMEVVLTPQTAATMQIWKASLEAAEAAYTRDKEERWVDLWLRWLCFLTVIQEKCSRGPLLHTWDEGRKLRLELENQPTYTAPCPW